MVSVSILWVASFLVVHDSTDIQVAVNEPYITACGAEQYVLVVDGHVYSVRWMNMTLLLLWLVHARTYFIFNICYVPGSHNIFKVSILNSNFALIELPPSIRHFVTSFISVDVKYVIMATVTPLYHLWIWVLQVLTDYHLKITSCLYTTDKQKISTSWDAE